MTSKINFEEENEAISEDPNFYRGKDGVFNFPNGDVYEGDFIAHISGLVWREGDGTYTTQDGQTYKGKWYSDQLVDTSDCEISYPKGAKYSGRLLKNQYSGPAMYSIDDGLHVLGEFAENKPVGHICLLDKQGREWNAIAGESDALLLPEHTYFNDIPPRLGKGALRIQRARPSSEKVSVIDGRAGAMDREALNKLELKIFAKTKKTLSDLKFEDSTWYQTWVNFRTFHDTVQQKVMFEGEDALFPEEKDWLTKYKAFKTKYNEIMDNREFQKYKNLGEYKLFELFNYPHCVPNVPIFFMPSEEDTEREPVEAVEEEYYARSFASYVI